MEAVLARFMGMLEGPMFRFMPILAEGLMFMSREEDGFMAML